MYAQGLNPAQIHYQQYINQHQNINTNQINIEYNKNDEHFVNKPIYKDKKPIKPPVASQDPQKDPKAFDGTKTLLKGTIPLEKSNQNAILAAKYMNSDLSLINEEELNITQSGLSKKISVISNSKNETVKENPMEEKKPEEAFPVDIIKENNQENVTQKPITESGMSDIDSKLDHLPTINSIMKGKSEPLPPTKKNKYSK